MAKKKLLRRSKVKKPTMASKQKSRVTVSDEDFLECLISFSKRAIGAHGTPVDEFFAQQVEKLQKELSYMKFEKELIKDLTK